MVEFFGFFASGGDEGGLVADLFFCCAFVDFGEHFFGFVEFTVVDELTGGFLRGVLVVVGE